MSFGRETEVTTQMMMQAPAGSIEDMVVRRFIREMHEVLEAHPLMQATMPVFTQREAEWGGTRFSWRIDEYRHGR